ncbi:MAG TPA: peptidoglycan recognition family protein [Pseudomonadales bacterium]|nr:peptidoglycan recognition family protein [Pseudomonadales bacterium]
MGYENVGRVWTLNSFKDYLASQPRPDWCRAITLHHTSTPSLAQRPKGMQVKHIESLRDFYKNEKGWSAGPHLFIDEDEIFGMCDLNKKGVHAVSFNSIAIGIEVLGDYDNEDPLSGRGLQCWNNAAQTVKALLAWLNLPASEDTVLFHRDDPSTKKSCPGKKVTKDWILQLIQHPSAPAAVTGDVKPDVGMAWDKWDFKGEKWCVPVYQFLLAKGLDSNTIIKNLKSTGGIFFYGTELLEGAYYVGHSSTIKPDQCTWAPARELMELLA